MAMVTLVSLAPIPPAVTLAGWNEKIFSACAADQRYR
jgi:hypothetical protein